MWIRQNYEQVKQMFTRYSAALLYRPGHSVKDTNHLPLLLNQLSLLLD